MECISCISSFAICSYVCAHVADEDTNMLSVDISVIYSIDTSRCFSIDRQSLRLRPTLYYLHEVSSMQFIIKQEKDEQKCISKYCNLDALLLNF